MQPSTFPRDGGAAGEGDRSVEGQVPADPIIRTRAHGRADTSR